MNKMIVAGLILLLNSAVFAEPGNSSDKIATLAQNYVLTHLQLAGDETADVKIITSKLPSEFPHCDHALQFSFAKDANTVRPNAVQVSCQSTGWRMFLPVDVEIFTDVLVTKRTLAAREIITAEDVELKPYNKNRLYQGYYTRAEEVTGGIVSHLTLAGSILTRRGVKQPALIHRNQTIKIVARSHGIAVSMRGIAKNDGALHEIIKVYNPVSKRMVDAVVNSANEAEVLA